MRYYYKSKDGTGFLNLRTPLNEDELNDYIEITEEDASEMKTIGVFVDTIS